MDSAGDIGDLLRTVKCRRFPARFACVLCVALVAFVGSDPVWGDDALPQKLQKLSMLRKGKQTDFAAVEAEGKSLLSTYNKPEELGRIYLAIVNIYAQTGLLHPVRAIELCQTALKYPISTNDRMVMYCYMGDHFLAGQWKDGSKLPERRRKAAAAYLQGLQELQKLNLPKTKPEERPSVPAAMTRKDGSPEGLKRYADAKRGFDKAVEEYQLLYQREVLAGQVAYAYSVEPHATDELRKELTANVKDPVTTELILTKLDIALHPEKAPKPVPRRRTRPTASPVDEPYERYAALARRAARSGPDAEAALAELSRSAKQNWPEFVSITGCFTRVPDEAISKAISQQGVEILPKVVIALREKKLLPHIASNAVGLLRPEVLDTVLQSSKDPSPEVRWWVARCLERFPKRSVNHLEVLKVLIQDADPEVAAAALIAVRRIGPPAASLKETVHKAQQNPSPRVEALALITEMALSTDKEAFPAEETVRKAGDPKKSVIVRYAALECLGNVRSTAASLDVLLKAVTDPDHSIRSAALQSLSRMGRDATAIAPDLLAQLQTGKAQDVSMVLQVIAHADPLPEGLEKVAIGYCNSKDFHEKLAGLNCLARISPLLSDAGVQAAIQRLKDPLDMVRMVSVDVLARVANRPDVLSALEVARDAEKNKRVQQKIERLLNDPNRGR